MRILLLLLISFEVYGQAQFSPPAGLTGADVREFYRQTAGIPFSADITVQVVQPMGDGAHKAARTSGGKVFRDFEGRTRVELLTPFVHINDPVARKGYTIDPARKTYISGALLTTLPSSGESLGKRTIEGLPCEGVRTLVRDIWTSKDLQIPLLITSHDPRTGETTITVTNIKRENPPADLFRVPSDFGEAGASNAGEGKVYQVGVDVLAPTPIIAPQPEYSKEALDAKFEGRVMLSIIIGTDGIPRDIKVVRPLGLGLDEKAIEAVSKWRFTPGMKGDKAVAVSANVEVTFRLLKDPQQQRQ